MLHARSRMRSKVYVLNSKSVPRTAQITSPHTCARGTCSTAWEMARQLQNMLKQTGGGRGVPGGASWGAGLLLGAGALGFGIQQSVYTGTIND